jgi:hypothetical protein
MKKLIDWAFNSSYIGPGIIVASLLVVLAGPIAVGIYYAYESLPKDLFIWAKENPLLTPLIIFGSISLIGVIVGLITWLVERRNSGKSKFKWLN